LLYSATYNLDSGALQPRKWQLTGIDCVMMQCSHLTTLSTPITGQLGELCTIYIRLNDGPIVSLNLLIGITCVIMLVGDCHCV